MFHFTKDKKTIWVYEERDEPYVKLPVQRNIMNFSFCESVNHFRSWRDHCNLVISALDYYADAYILQDRDTRLSFDQTYFIVPFIFSFYNIVPIFCENWFTKPQINCDLALILL